MTDTVTPGASRSASVPRTRLTTTGTPMGATVALIADDPAFLVTMEATLTGEGFCVEVDARGDLAYDLDRLRGVDLSLIDLGLRERPGVEVCEALRSRSSAPVLATARVADEPTVLAAFAAGADQFTPLDTSPRQFVARLRSLLRRLPQAVVAPPVLRGVGPVVLDAGLGAVVVRGTTVALSAQEFDVLGALVARPGRVVTRRELLGIHGSLSQSDRRLDFVIRRLRQKLEGVDGRRRITVVRGVGFRFECDGDEASGGAPDAGPGASDRTGGPLRWW